MSQLQESSSLLKAFGITIDQDLKSKLCGRELLTIMKETESERYPVGGMCIDIKQGESTQQNNFLILVSTKFRLDENSIGISKLLAWVTDQFDLIEEKRTEILKHKGGQLEKKDLYIAKMTDGGLYAHRDVTGKAQVFFRYPVKQIENFISEGANILLMKCFSLYGKCFDEQVLRAITIDGYVYDNIYSADFIKTTSCKQLLVKRSIQRPQYEDAVSYAALGADEAAGTILELKWLNSQISVFFLPPEDTTEHIDQASTYLKRLSDNRAYFKYEISSRPNLSATLDDYVQDLLLHKPEHILKFTHSYFKRFGTI